MEKNKYVKLIELQMEAIVDSINYYLEKKDIGKARDSIQNLINQFGLLLKIIIDDKIETKEGVC